MAARPEPACTHQPADRLIAASGANQLRSIGRDEKGRPGHPRPARRGATSISCVTPRHLSCAAGRAPPPRTVRPVLPSLAGPAARVATGRSRPAHTGVSPVLSPARLCRPPWATGQVLMARHRLLYWCWWQSSGPMLRWARISGWLGGCGWPGSARADRSFTRQPGRAGLRPVTRNRTAGMVSVNQEPGGGGQQAAACHPGQHRHLMSCYDINGRQPGLASPLPAHSGKPGCQSGCAP